MSKRIFRAISLASFIVFIACAVLFFGVLYGYFSEMQLDSLQTQTLLAAEGVEAGGLDYLEEMDTTVRISWIAADGSVLYDSDADTAAMENHLDREEVKEALSSGYGESIRYSDTLLERYLYAAQLLSDGSVLRLAQVQNSALVLLYEMLQPICIITAIILVLGFVLAHSFSKKIAKSLNNLDVEHPLQNKTCDEIMPLLLRLQKQQEKIEEQKDELQKSRQQFESATANMKEGVVLLNSSGTVLSINGAARRFLGQGLSAGCSIATRAAELGFDTLLKDAEQGNAGEKIIAHENEKYKITATPIAVGGGTAGVSLLFFDVTKKEEAEQLRREFTANVSHELKTPLHSISGYAELLANEMVKPADIGRFSKEIYSEAQRMICLVDDIMKLSHLDEGVFDTEFETLRLDALAENTAASFLSKAQKAGVEIETNTVACEIHAIPHLAESILYNLCDNAIKYNKPGGKVTLSVKNSATAAQLTVADTGIGIAPEHQKRIFERFYRVDKSHSKDIGGTGLGLSIVKHAARLLGAQIDLASTPGHGTTVTVSFPKKG